MKLSRLEIRNFRSCYATDVELADDLTLIVGENDAGKTNIIDALRLAVPPVSGKPSIWFDADRDHSSEATDTSISVRRFYTDLSTDEDAFYTPALVDEERDLVHTTTFNTAPGLQRRHRLGLSVGRAAMPDPEPENRDRIAHVYLPPLRDAVAALGSPSGNRLGEMIEILAEQFEIDAFLVSGNTSLSALAREPVPAKVTTAVQKHLTRVTQPVRGKVVSVNHRSQRLQALARSLRLHMAAEGLTPADLVGSGLGYANLLFIATLIVELEKANEYDLLLLLVEEPEAHLHPQLQSVLLRYLEEQAATSGNPTDPLEPAGRIQVIATSHSPHLTSSVSTRKIVVARCQERTLEPDEEGAGTNAEPETDESAAHLETVAVALAAAGLGPFEQRKIDRYLDTTRAALVFARQVILVEGIAEAVLLRTLAEKVLYPESRDSGRPDDANRRKREQFRAISIVPIGGVDFMPYARLLLGNQHELVDRLVVVTDGDGQAGQRRRAELEQTFGSSVAAGTLHVAVGETTFEAEMYAATGNEGVLREAFLVQHPRSAAKWDEKLAGADDDPRERAQKFSKALKDKTLDLGKGDFAHVVADLLADSTEELDFEVPEYLRGAIESALLAVPQGLGDGTA